jgi:uncharacterized protein YciI
MQQIEEENSRMAKFLVLTTFASQEKRREHRAEHRVYLREQVDAGKLLMAGPFDDEAGGILIFEAADEAEVLRIMDEDPFTTGDVFATTEIRPFTQVAP